MSMNIEEIRELDKKVLAQTYGRQSFALVKGRGSIVWDSEGNEYIDCVAGLAVLNVGHSHPKVVNAVKEQAEKIMHTSNLYTIIPQVQLAELLFDVSGGYKSFFCNSGAEANEAAIKLVRKHTKKSGIIACRNSFHGRTITTLSATGQEKYKKDFEPMCREFSHVPFGDIGALENAIDDGTAAVMLEPIQGEGGVVMPPEGYLKAVRELCDEKGLLLILDEVQTGFGRTGAMFAWQKYGVEPDIFTVAKAIGGGFPMGAMLAKPEIMDAFVPGDHAATFGGNHLACAAGKAAVEVIVEEKLADRAGELGAYLKERLGGLKENHDIIKEIRGVGLMVGVELEVGCSDIVEKMKEKGILINCANDNVIRFLPPLVIEKEELDKAVEALNVVLK
jgi:acetylornithine/N-succinyldiaminopimelate aminotransferase